MEERPILGIWTWEEFLDNLAMATVTAVGAFCTYLIYSGIRKYLELTKW